MYVSVFLTWWVEASLGCFVSEEDDHSVDLYKYKYIILYMCVYIILYEHIDMHTVRVHIDDMYIHTYIHTHIVIFNCPYSTPGR